MKARLELNTSGQAILALVPENLAERKDIELLASGRFNSFFFRGFKYMDPEAEFLIQQSGSDR